MTTTSRLNQIIETASQYRAFVREQANRSGSTCPIRVVPGRAAPHAEGSSGYFTTPGGKPVRYPNAYRRAWGKPVYNASTYRIEVGAKWLAARSIPEWCMTVAATAEELVRVGAFGPTGQSAVGIGTTPELALETLPLVGGWVPPKLQVVSCGHRQAA